MSDRGQSMNHTLQHHAGLLQTPVKPEGQRLILAA